MRLALGRYFDFNMSEEDHKSEVYETLTNILNEIDDLALHPQNKILLYSRYVLFKISWHFTVSDIGKIWVNDKLEVSRPRISGNGLNFLFLQPLVTSYFLTINLD